MGKMTGRRISDLPVVVISEDFIIRHCVVFFIFAMSQSPHQRGNLCDCEDHFVIGFAGENCTVSVRPAGKRGCSGGLRAIFLFCSCEVNDEC
ncbi:hypothetical protein RBA41_00175 [Massilia sp. CCM 9210]|uniref:hypothetical protein n=1 Tax=Massilia scottii TaxID=3057166 RepID=UPI002796B9B6|nr:hypothetical protein [Massilia sp. CCM 9210]MDQ1811714.1 hypothetical protein [Massilia sp. CCM 9210]